MNARVAAGLYLLLLPSIPTALASAQACATERLASPVGAIENEFGWVIDRDGTRFLITAAEELAQDPVTGEDWGDDGGFYIVDALPGGGFSVSERIQWSATSAYELGRTGVLEGDLAVLGDTTSSSIGDLFGFIDNGSGFVPDAKIPHPLHEPDFDLAEGRLVLAGRDWAGGSSLMLMKTFERVAGAWSLTHTFDFGPNEGGDVSVALDGDRAYVAFGSGNLRRLVWNGSGWSDGGSTSIPHAGAPFGRTLATDGGRIVGVGSDGSGGALLYSFLETGGAPLLEVPVALPASQVPPSSLTIHGDRVAIGYPWEDAKRGRVEILTRLGSSWQRSATLRAAVDEAGEFYGQGLAFTEDGRLLVGAPHATDAGFFDRGYVEVVRFDGVGCASLMPHPSTVSVTGFGSPIDFALVGPSSVAGASYALLFASAPAFPGIPLGPVLLPLANDALLLASVVHANGAVLQGTIGVLDPAGGSGQPRIDVQAMGPAAVGTTIAAAWLAFSSTSPAGMLFASEARALTFVP